MFGKLVERIKRKKNTYLGEILSTRGKEIIESVPEMSQRFPGEDFLDIFARAVMEDYESETAAAARAYFTILSDNEHLPDSLQIPERELLILRSLLLEYFKGTEEMTDHSLEVLALIEKKFIRGYFCQARLLLQIFDTDEETRVSNERNLFYEEMITRLGSQMTCNNVLTGEEQMLASRGYESDEDFYRLCELLATNHEVNFCLSLKDPAEVRYWEELGRSLNIAAQTDLLRVLPIKRWRRIDKTDNLSLVDQIRIHCDDAMLRQYVRTKILMGYFLLLTSGNTGFEDYIFRLTDWTHTCFGADFLDVMPFIHRCCVIESLAVNEAAVLVTERFFLKRLRQMTFSDEEIQRAVQQLLLKFSAVDFSRVPCGNFNFGFFVLDEILAYPMDESSLFSFRLYKLL